MEERLSNQSQVERAKDEESVRSRKLVKLAEKYKRELNEAHVELQDLRARCLTTSEIQVFLSVCCSLYKTQSSYLVSCSHRCIERNGWMDH